MFPVVHHGTIKHTKKNSLGNQLHSHKYRMWACCHHELLKPGVESTLQFGVMLGLVLLKLHGSKITYAVTQVEWE